MVSKSKILKCYQCEKQLEEIEKIEGTPTHSYECPDMHCAINVNELNKIDKYILFIMDDGSVKYKIEQANSYLIVSEKISYREYKTILYLPDTFIPLSIRKGKIVGVDKLLKRLYKLVAFI